MLALMDRLPSSDDTRGTAKVSFDDACHIVCRVGLAAHGYGCSAGQLETYLSRLLTVLGYRGVIRTGPTELLLAIDEEGGRWQRLYLAERESGSLDATRAEAAEELNLSINTVKSHLRSAYRKLGVERREAALARANALGLLGLEGPARAR